MVTESVWCQECDHEHDCEVVQEEFGDWLDVPEFCEECGAPMWGVVGSDKREDFHADG